MSSKKRMVIDASVAMSAGDSKTDDTASKCRRFMNAFLKEGYLLVMTPKLHHEWHDDAPHKARWIANSKKWYTRFRRAQIVWKRDEEIQDDELRQLIETFPSPKAMREDVHLIEAAQATDQMVISRDNVVDDFAKLTRTLEKIQGIIWFNPVEEEAPELWLKNGAPADDHRKLGNRPLTDD